MFIFVLFAIATVGVWGEFIAVFRFFLGSAGVLGEVWERF